MIHVLDLKFQNYEKAIAAFLVETSAGPVLIETGPYSTFESLEKEVELAGFDIGDIKHVLLSHIHLDHAGAAWAMAELGAQLYLHPFGFNHMADPSKLMESATRIYGDQMDTLWGTMKEIPKEKLTTMEDLDKVNVGDKVFTALHTPGHAHHHIAWKMDNIIFTGDIAGVKIENGPVVPPCPPPDINLEKWIASISRVLEQKPKQLYLTHFGLIEDVESHMIDLQKVLNDWAFWIKSKWESGLDASQITPEFMKYTASQLRDLGIDEKGIERYETANPSWMSVAGLIRYWKKKSEQA